MLTLKLKKIFICFFKYLKIKIKNLLDKIKKN